MNFAGHSVKSLCWKAFYASGEVPSGGDALSGGALDLSNVSLLYIMGHSPKPSSASGGAPFLLAERGERPPKGDTPFGNPHGQTHSGLRLRGTKGRSRLRNRSLVVPDKVPPADLYVESQAFYRGKCQLAHRHKKSAHSSGVPLVRPLEQSM